MTMTIKMPELDWFGAEYVDAWTGKPVRDYPPERTPRAEANLYAKELSRQHGRVELWRASHSARGRAKVAVYENGKYVGRRG